VILLNFVKNQYFRHKGGFSSIGQKQNPLERNNTVILNTLNKQAVFHFCHAAEWTDNDCLIYHIQVTDAS